MAVTLSDADYGRMMWAMREIACGYRMNAYGNHQRMSREELKTTARAVCEQFGWSYGLADIQKLEQA